MCHNEQTRLGMFSSNGEMTVKPVIPAIFYDENGNTILKNISPLQILIPVGVNHLSD